MNICPEREHSLTPTIQIPMVDDMDRENLNNVVQLETPTQMHFNAI